MNDQQNGPGAALDELDIRILQVLQSEARITNRDLAAAVHVSPTTALDRTRSLRRRGVITGATLTLDFAALGRGVQAVIAVRIRPPSREIIEAFRDWVAGLDETVGVFVTSGSEDFIIHVAVRDNQDLYAFVIDELTQRREVADVRTSVVYEHLREQVVLPLEPHGRAER
ncbi:Lrp/AsnC family transcriptional regulator [Rathayibacter sp. VKM Ac-2801]|uniref:Lrp/AsnC family transcriptional regulator n=1 Tax=Rathayibacter sp. VKM Ac-2801 TaxID=2609255 RepID=UPI00131FFCBC|nr:Lrp/AsnC family transcriptional regulator [Rathayibacter sp. VKM Ac-2801]QHC71336.1 winged helix-turn-helix transcriptional regulator [Rathayibacter sp. VKM Ac-2801]